MKNFLSRCKYGLILAAIILVSFVLGITGIVSLDSPKTYWQTDTVTAGEKTFDGYTIIDLKFESGQKLNTIYINYGDINYTETERPVIRLSYRYSASYTIWSSETKIEYDNVIFAEDGTPTFNYGWVKVADNLDYSYAQVKILTSSSVKINEVVFLDAEGKTLSAKVNCEYYFDGTTFNEVKADDLKKSNSALNLVDEQDTFNAESTKYNSLSERELYAFASIKSIMSSRNCYINAKLGGPFGYFLVGIGTLIFGTNNFGLRIMPLLFYCLSIFMLYVLGKKLFGAKTSLLVAALYALSGVGLSLGTTVSVDALALTFVFAMIYFFTGFASSYKRNKKFGDCFPNLLLSGLMLAVAVTVKPITIALILPAIIAFVYLYIVRQKANRVTLSTSSSESKIEAIKVDNISTIFAAFASLIILPLLLSLMFFVVFSTSYITYFGGNAFTAFFNQIGAAFTTAIPNASGSFIGKYFYNELSIFTAKNSAEIKALIPNVIVVLVSVAAFVYAFVAAIKDKKNLMPILGLLLTVVIAKVAALFVSGSGVADMYITESVLLLFVGIAIGKLNDTDKKFTLFGSSVAIGDAIAYIALAFALVIFALALPLALAYSAPNGYLALFTWIK